MANHYIRDGASGDGSDWTNALDDLPASFVRGDTYYVADGTYGGHTFSTAVSGATYITVQKATADDHGTETGWNSGYGDGTATFTATIEFETSYWVFDGVTGGGPGSWDSGYGFAVTIDAPGAQAHNIDFGSSAKSYIDIRHVDLNFTSMYEDYPYLSIDNLYLYGSGDVTSHVTMSYCALRYASRNCITMGYNDYSVFEYCYFAHNHQCYDSGNHAQLVQDYPSSSRYVVFRHCLSDDVVGTGAIVPMGDGTSRGSSYWDIYGCTFRRGVPARSLRYHDFTDGAITIINGVHALGWKVYNNTFDGLIGLSDNPCSPFNSNQAYAENCGHQVYNNLCYSMYTPSITFDAADSTSVHDYNHFQSCTGTLPTETHRTTGSGDPFLSRTNNDYRLLTDTGAGLALVSPYNADPYGEPRGSNGVWDAGAYDYTGRDARIVLGIQG